MIACIDQKPVEAVARVIRAQKPDALLIAGEDMLFPTSFAVAMLGLSVPEDLSVIGYDDISWPSAESQGLTTIRQPLDEMGHIALELLDEYFRTGIPPVSRTVSPSLIERSSVAG